jgi:hypothetical protein
MKNDLWVPVVGDVNVGRLVLMGILHVSTLQRRRPCMPWEGGGGYIYIYMLFDTLSRERCRRGACFGFAAGKAAGNQKSP